MSSPIKIDFSKFFFMKKDERKRLLGPLVRDLPRGEKIRLAQYCGIGQRQVTYWGSGESYPSATRERKAVEFLERLQEQLPEIMEEAISAPELGPYSPESKGEQDLAMVARRIEAALRMQPEIRDKANITGDTIRYIAKQHEKTKQCAKQLVQAMWAFEEAVNQERQVFDSVLQQILDVLP